jgi:hypothetical protein
MAKPDTVYRVPVGDEVKIITAQSRAQAIRAAVKPMLGEVQPLSAIELAAELAGGAAIENAATILAGEPETQGGENEQE